RLADRNFHMPPASSPSRINDQADGSGTGTTGTTPLMFKSLLMMYVPPGAILATHSRPHLTFPTVDMLSLRVAGVTPLSKLNIELLLATSPYVAGWLTTVSTFSPKWQKPSV